MPTLHTCLIGSSRCCFPPSPHSRAQTNPCLEMTASEHGLVQALVESVMKDFIQRTTQRDEARRTNVHCATQDIHTVRGTAEKETVSSSTILQPATATHIFSNAENISWTVTPCEFRTSTVKLTMPP